MPRSDQENITDNPSRSRCGSIVLVWRTSYPRWEDVPESWACPDCGVAKADFVMAEI